ncbi:chemotaxis protein CheW [Duganella sp. FT94W]|uniref:Chemotaxis protein CheW n=1 Tax=Duganella lactea TaxID=2692173 RepID=A0ABW9V177_9BURK|nr:chemotaxis protein CheW [Duganella lactea]MYM33476.1 chemotaxis protein CheW [Duganella lactea]
MELLAKEQSQSSSLVFGLGQEAYAINILAVQELCGYSRVTELANTPDYFKGVVNLRGIIVPLIDLRIHFGFSAPSYNDSTVVIMITLCGKTTGIVVDSVADVVTLDSAQVKPAPELGGGSAAYMPAIASVDDRMIIMLNIEALVRDLCPAQAEPLAA